MQLTRSSLIAILNDAGIYRPSWRLLDESYETFDPDWVAAEAWPAWVGSLPAHLTEFIPVGGSKTLQRPKWIAEVFDCDDHSLDFWVFVIRCCAAEAARTNLPRPAAAFGTMSYRAVPKPGNRRDGPHDINWFIGHDQVCYWFEPSDCAIVRPTAEEIISVWEGEAR